MFDDILAYSTALRAYSRALCRNRAEADDLFQDTVLRAMEKIDQYQPGTNMRAWLFTIMRNSFLTNCHKIARERTGSEDCVSGKPQMKPDQEWHLMAVEMLDALQDMPVHYRRTIVMVGALGVSYQDAASMLDCDIGTVKSRVNRARSILREKLHPDFC